MGILKAIIVGVGSIGIKIFQAYKSMDDGDGEINCIYCGHRMKKILSDEWECPTCGVMASIEDGEIEFGEDPAEGYSYDDVYDDMPDYCRNCGGNYPDCCDSCSTYESLE